MIIASLLSLAVALYCYAISQLQQQGKLRWKDNLFGFWGDNSDRRKYKNYDEDEGPAFFLATTWLVFLTDGYHFMQFWFFNFLSLSIVLAIGWNLWWFLGILFGVRIVHWSARKLLSK